MRDIQAGILREFDFQPFQGLLWPQGNPLGLLGHVYASTSSDICCMGEAPSRKCRVISVIINSQRQREHSVSDSLLRTCKASLGVILVSLIMGRIHLSSWLFLGPWNPLTQDCPHRTGDLPTQNSSCLNNEVLQPYFLMLLLLPICLVFLWTLLTYPLQPRSWLTWPSIHSGPITYRPACPPACRAMHLALSVPLTHDCCCCSTLFLFL